MNAICNVSTRSARVRVRQSEQCKRCAFCLARVVRDTLHRLMIVINGANRRKYAKSMEREWAGDNTREQCRALPPCAGARWAGCTRRAALTSRACEYLNLKVYRLRVGRK